MRSTLALFVVITENGVFRLQHGDKQSLQMLASWQNDLRAVDGFNPVVIGASLHVPHDVDNDLAHVVDSIGIVTVHDGPSLEPGAIIAPRSVADKLESTITTTRILKPSWPRAVGADGSTFR